MEMNFCRRCGAALTHMSDHVFVCENGHTIYGNSSPTVDMLLINSKQEALIVKRALDPGKGELALPGGFCDAKESLEETLQRELMEELDLKPSDYDTPQFLCSDTSQYGFKGEAIPALSVIFWARLRQDNVALTVGDDVAEMLFIPLEHIDLQKIFFPPQRKAIKILIEKLVK
jgi:ADP-ribose pyrophosphatase YjhB (NUDIX family)